MPSTDASLVKGGVCFRVEPAVEEPAEGLGGSARSRSAQ